MERYEITVDDSAFEDDEPEREPQEKLKLKSTVSKRKGRGFSSVAEAPGLGSITHFDSLSSSSMGRAMQSVEGWTLFVTGLHEEIGEEQLLDLFSEHGSVKSVRLSLDHRTGFVKGYALVDFSDYHEALQAKETLDGSLFLDCPMRVDFAFVKPSFE